MVRQSDSKSSGPITPDNIKAGNGPTPEQQATYTAANGRCTTCHVPVSLGKAHFIISTWQLLCPLCTAVCRVYLHFPGIDADVMERLINKTVFEVTGSADTPRESLTGKQIRDISELLAAELSLL